MSRWDAILMARRASKLIHIAVYYKLNKNTVTHSWRYAQLKPLKYYSCHWIIENKICIRDRENGPDSFFGGYLTDNAKCLVPIPIANYPQSFLAPPVSVQPLHTQTKGPSVLKTSKGRPGAFVRQGFGQGSLKSLDDANSRPLFLLWLPGSKLASF